MGTATSGRVWAWFGFLLGITASISANVTHSYLVITATGRDNLTGAVISAAFWPLALFLCLEVMSRVSWPYGWVWWVVRYLGLSLVAAIAAIVSWQHMNGLLDTYGEDSFIAILGPIAVDGLMVVCSSALLAIADNLKRRAEQYENLPLDEVDQLPPPKPATPVKPLKSRSKLPDPKRPPTIDRNAEARQMYHDSVAAGEPLTGEELGERFGRSGRWGRDRVNDAKAELQSNVRVGR